MDGTKTGGWDVTAERGFVSEHRISIPPRFEHLADVRAAVRTILDGTDADLDALYLIAITEVVTNAIEEHHRIGTAAEIEIVVDARRRVVGITDSGSGYDPADRVARRQVADGGWGLRLAEAGAPGLTWELGIAGGTTFELPYPRS